MADPIKVITTVNFSDALIARLREVSPRLEIIPRPSRTYTDVVADVWRGGEVLYTANVLPPPEAMPNLKWIQSHFAGVDNILGQPLVVQKPDVLVTSTSGIHATNMAEYTFAMMLGLGHNLLHWSAEQRRKVWADNRHDNTPYELRGATIGIVGYGAIGREIARLAKAFGMTVLASKRNLKQVEEKETYVLEGTGDPQGEMFDRLYPSQALGTMVRDCDFVVITLPLTSHTQNMFDARIIQTMKKGSFLINVGRGGIVDEAALISALKSGHLRGAASDVFAQEPLPQDSPFWDMPNFILTPHISGNTADYHDKAVTIFEENLRRYVEGKPLLNLVSRDDGY